jgi:hypothetical protein
MEVLLGKSDGLPPLVLDKKQLIINTELPEAKKKEVSPPKEATEELLAAGAKFRGSRQEDIKVSLDTFQDEERKRKLFIEKSWDTANDADKQDFLNMISNYNLPEYKSLIDYIKEERAWWKSDYSKGLTESTLESLFSDFKDTVSDKKKAYENAVETNSIKGKELIEKRKENKKEGFIDWNNINKESVVQSKVSKQEKDPFNRSLWDDIQESWVIILGYLGTLLWIIFGLRFASFTVNEYFYMKTPYKILFFVYIFIFTPFIFPYYIYKLLRTWYDPIHYPPVLYRSFFPTYGYDPDKTPITTMDTWFGYRLDGSTIEYIRKMAEIEHNTKLEVLQKSVMYDLKEELAKGLLMAAKPPPPKGC